jgi:hypothetical protein
VLELTTEGHVVEEQRALVGGIMHGLEDVPLIECAHLCRGWSPADNVDDAQGAADPG